MGCSTVEKSEFIEERNKKLDSLKEECDFVTIESKILWPNYIQNLPICDWYIVCFSFL